MSCGTFVTTAWRIITLRMEETAWRVAVNILNKQSPIASRGVGGSSSLVVGRVGLTTPYCEKTVTKCYTGKENIWTEEGWSGGRLEKAT
jgi:hypothetical protein